MVNYHPAPELLAEYSSGSMALSHSLCVAAHLEYCSACRQHVSKLNQLGAHYFEQLPVKEQQGNDKLKNKVFAMLDDDIEDDEPVKLVPETTEVQRNIGRGVKSLGQFMQGSYDDLDWSRISPTIKLATLLKDKDGSQIALSRTQPGGKMPHHSHTGDEITVVLKGSFSDESGVYCQGDFIYREAKDKHSPVVTKDAECICLMVLDAPIQFTGFFTRLLNPLIRKQHAES